MSITKRETEVLTLIGKGFSNKEIGRALIISENTVKFHLQNIYEKLGAQNRTQAFALYMTSKMQNN